MAKTLSINYFMDFLYWLADSVVWLFSSLWHFAGVPIIYALTYFIDIRSEVHVMFFAFTLDLVLGILKSMIMDSERFMMKKAFIGFMRLLISLTIISLLYGMDREMHQDSVCLHRIFTYIVTGAWVASFAENGYILTKWKPFLKVKGLVERVYPKKEEKPKNGEYNETTE